MSADAIARRRDRCRVVAASRLPFCSLVSATSVARRTRAASPSSRRSRNGASRSATIASLAGATRRSTRRDRFDRGTAPRVGVPGEDARCEAWPTSQPLARAPRRELPAGSGCGSRGRPELPAPVDTIGCPTWALNRHDDPKPGDVSGSQPRSWSCVRLWHCARRVADRRAGRVRGRFPQLRRRSRCRPSDRPSDLPSRPRARSIGPAAAATSCRFRHRSIPPAG